MIGSIQNSASDEEYQSPKGKAPIRKSKKAVSSSSDFDDEPFQAESDLGSDSDAYEEDDDEEEEKPKKGAKRKAAPKAKAAPAKKATPAKKEAAVPAKKAPAPKVTKEEPVPRKVMKPSLGGVNLPSTGQPPIRMGLSRKYRSTKPLSPVRIIPPRD